MGYQRKFVGKVKGNTRFETDFKTIYRTCSFVFTGRETEAAINQQAHEIFREEGLTGIGSNVKRIVVIHVCITDHTGNGPCIVKGIAKLRSNTGSRIFRVIVIGQTQLTTHKKLCIGRQHAKYQS